MSENGNGKKKVTVIAAGLAAVCSILSWLGGTYTGWSQRVEAAVLVQRMVNAHDETLKDLVPRVQTNHEINEHQQWDIDQNKRDISALTEQVKTLAALQQQYLQAQMREGRIPR